MVACGGAVVSTRVGAIDEFAVHDVSAMLADVGDVHALAEGVLIILQSDQRRERLTQNGRHTAARFDVSIVTRCFEGALAAAARRPDERTRMTATRSVGFSP